MNSVFTQATIINRYHIIAKSLCKRIPRKFVEETHKNKKYNKYIYKPKKEKKNKKLLV